jgi:hypothetical protein
MVETSTTGAFMDGFQACPECYGDIDVVVVPQQRGQNPKRYYFVNCQSCGEGSKEALASIEELKKAWNDFVTDTVV